MQLASQWLIHQSLSIEVVAERLGYASQAAFSRAYKRVMGHPPGATRRERHEFQERPIGDIKQRLRSSHALVPASARPSCMC